MLEKLATIQMLDVSFPTTDGRRLVMPRYTEPNPEQALLLHQLNLVLPPATASAHHHCRLVSPSSPTQNVVETFEVPLLKTKGIPASDLPNCEGDVAWSAGSKSFALASAMPTPNSSWMTFAKS